MTVHLYVGLQGSGKSYDAVANQVLPALRQGRIVVTNIALHEERIRESFPDADLRMFDVERVVAEPDRIFEYVSPGALLVVDEAWKVFPSGVKVNQAPEAFKKLFAEHRHMVDAKGVSTQIVLITQRPSQLAAYARDLVGMTYMHTKLSTVGRSQSYRVDIYQGCAKGDNPPREHRIREIFGNYKPEVYRFYRSHTMSEAGADGADETPVDTRGVVWKRPVLWVGLVALVLMLGFGGSGAYAFFNPPVDGSRPVSSEPRSSLPSMPTPLSPAAASAVEPSASWRLTAVIERPSRAQSFAILERGSEREFVALDRCLKLPLNGWSCPVDGEYWGWNGRRSPAAADPLPN